MNGSLATALKSQALRIGFDRIGITDARPPENFDRYRQWIRQGFAAEMWYLTEKSRIEKRGNPQKVLPGAQSIIMGSISYAPRTKKLPTDARMARYGWGKDYHEVVQEKLNQLVNWLKEQTEEDFSYLVYVDTGPILERSLAQRAGLGWIGKNTCLIHEKTGSYTYLGAIITTLSLPGDVPAMNRCGTCTLCLEACPTNAIVAPYLLDARRCISYHTIENRAEPIPSSIAPHQNGWIAGCDICQEVCPWNRRPAPVRLEKLLPLPHAKLSLEEASKLDKEGFEAYFGATTFRRITWEKFSRNVQSALLHRKA